MEKTDHSQVIVTKTWVKDKSQLFCRTTNYLENYVWSQTVPLFCRMAHHETPIGIFQFADLEQSNHNQILEKNRSVGEFLKEITVKEKIFNRTMEITVFCEYIDNISKKIQKKCHSNHSFRRDFVYQQGCPFLFHLALLTTKKFQAAPLTAEPIC